MTFEPSTPVSSGSTSATARLTAGFAVRAMRDLALRAQVENTTTVDVFVLDRLWTLEGGSRPVPDAELVYRFVREGSLRLLFGVCPLPRRFSVLFKNVPHVTRLQPGETLPIEIELAGPVREYSFYFPLVPGSGERRASIKEIDLVVQVIRQRPDLKLHDSWLGAPALELQSPEATEWLETIRVRSGRVELDVLERTDELERLRLPGEPLRPL